MKKIVSAFIVFAFFANVSAQLKVNSLGHVEIGSSIGTTNNVPLTFKVDNILAGYTGSAGNTNVSFGFSSLNPLAGYNNIALGVAALYYNSTGYSNTATGIGALYYNSNGSGNTATGNSALYYNTCGVANVANGTYTLYKNQSGYCNTAIGLDALYNNTSGSMNTAIGYNADVSANNLTNATAIGNGATATASNQVVIGNGIVTSIGGFANWSNISDGRAKKNIRANVPGLDFINRLQPITYNLDLNAIDELQKSNDPEISRFRDSLRMAISPEEREIEVKARANKEKIVETGFVAQDVEKTAKSIGYDFSGVNVDEKGIYSLSYSEFVVPLVKAVQELSEQNDRLQGIVDELKKRVEILENAPAVSLRSETGENSTTKLSNTPVEQCKLYQNTPNPFKEKTEIHYYLTPEVQTADIYVFNLQGDLLKKFPATHSGVVEVTSLHLLPGMYVYTLVVDGQPVDSKRMILTK